MLFPSALHQYYSQYFTDPKTHNLSSLVKVAKSTSSTVRNKIITSLVLYPPDHSDSTTKRQEATHKSCDKGNFD